MNQSTNSAISNTEKHNNGIETYWEVGNAKDKRMCAEYTGSWKIKDWRLMKIVNNVRSRKRG